MLRRARCWRMACEDYALSASTASGRIRGRPRPTRPTATVARVGSKATESWRCPTVVRNPSGRHRPSAARWTLVESPPRDRPSDSRSCDFFGGAGCVEGDSVGLATGRSLSFDRSPCVARSTVMLAAAALEVVQGDREPVSSDIVRGCVGRSRSVLMGADHRRVDSHVPRLGLRVAAALQLLEQPVPGPIGRPEPMPVVDGLPGAVVGGQVTPRTARPHPPHHAVDHGAVIGPTATCAARGRPG
jgi:hypothetical protein